jgi:VCBS repeat-containing protein
VDGDALTAVWQGGPSNGTLTLNADGSFTYTPDAGFVGPDSFTYQVNDGNLDSNVAAVSIDVNPVNDAPVAVGDAYVTDEDTPLTVAAPGVLGNDSDADGDAISASLVSNVSHGTLVLNADGSFTYTPDPNYNGTDSFTYVATDGSLDSGVATVSIAVNPINDAPVAVDDAYATDEGTPLTVPALGVLGNDSDLDNDPLTAVLVSGVSNGALTLNADGSFTYTPSGGYSGPDSFAYVANDGSLDSSVATVNIDVNPVNDAPVAVDDAYTTAEDTPLAVAAPGVLGNDSDVDGDALTAVLVSNASYGTLTLNTDGSFTYAPDADYSGPDSFSYVANDGSLDSSVATVSITVNPVNDAPVAVDDAYTTAQDTPLSVAAPGVLTNDGDVEGDALAVILVSDVSQGALTLSPDGSFVYTPTLGFIGTDSFTYVANDGQADSSLATVSITVSAPPISVTGIVPNSMGVSASVQVIISGSGLVAGAEVSFEGGIGPAPAASNIVVAADGKSLTATLTTKSGGPGRPRVWSVRVTNPDGSTAVLVDAFTVNP